MSLSKLKKLDSNNKLIFKNVFFAFLVKGGALVISLWMTPAFIDYFDNNAVLGVWYTLLSVLMWFLSFDLGIGNGIRNNLVKDLAAKDYESARKTISSGMFATAVVAVVLGIIGYGFISFIDLNWLYQMENEVVSYKALFSATLFVFAGILIRFFLTTVSSVFYALQMSAVNNFLHLSVSISQLLFVLLAPSASPEESLVHLAIAYMILSNLPVLIAGIVVFCTKLKQCRPGIRYIDKKHLKIVMEIGSIFFICQILYMLIVNTNEFLITNLFGPQYTTEYTFYHKISNIVSMVMTLAMTPVWSVITKAMAEKKYAWLNQLYKRVKLFGACAVVLQFLCVPFQQIIMDVWLGKGVLDVNYITALSFACFGGAFVYSGILSTIVCGMARMKLQTVFYGIGVVAKFLLVYLLKDIVESWTIVVWSNAIILVPYCVFQQIDLNRYLKKLVETEQNTIKPLII